MAVKKDFSIIKGDTFTLDLKFKDANGNPIDLTNKKLIMTVKTDYSVDDTGATIQKIITTHTNATNGETQIKLTSTDTSVNEFKYVYDIQMSDTATNDVTTLFIGYFEVNPEVTRSV